jgi:hypothetical protein
MAWQHAQSSDFDGLPPPVQPRQSNLTRQELENINTHLGGLKIQASEIQNTLTTHV